MQLIKGPAPEADSTKQECFIQIGKHRHRIANDHHAALTDLRASFFRYAPMDELLFMTSLIGASLLLNLPLLPLINVEKRAQQERR